MRLRARGKAPLLIGTALAVTSLVAAGCAKSSDGGGGSGSGDANTVTIWSSLDQPVQDGLVKALEAKIKSNGDDITIKWQKVENINQLIITRIQSGDTPDIALVPQPGVVSQMNDLGAIKPMDDAVDMDSLKSSMLPGSLEAGTIDGKLDGLLVSANVKGLIFYPKQAWASEGYDASTVSTIDDLNSLTDKMKSDGNVPWCMGIESDTATGWPATDWMETLVARYGGADQYNDWVSHKVNFDSTLVKKAADEFSSLILTDGNTYGGRSAIASNNFGTAGSPMFDSPPKCQMYMQGSFITSFFPDNVVSDLDANVGVFGFPPDSTTGDNPVTGGGDLMTMLNDSDQVKKVVGYLSETDIGDDAAPSSSFISPHTDFDTSLYPNDLTRTIAGVAYDASDFLFDASDSMPAEVGAGSFWTEMTAWISNQEDLDTALKNIDSSWPSS